MKRPRSLRFRMMVLFSAVVGVLLACSYLGFYLLLDGEVRVQLDRQLLETSKPLVADLMRNDVEQDVNKLDLPDRYFELLNSSGNVLQQSINLQNRPLEFRTQGWDLSKATFRTIQDPSRGRLRLGLIPFQRGDRTFVQAVAIPTAGTNAVLESFGRIILFLLPLSLLVTAAISAWYTGRSLAPVSALTLQAAQMSERANKSGQPEFWTPLLVAHPQDELGRLAETFNRLFAQIDSALRQMRQFVSDASHELRTPLSVLQGETELVLSAPRSVDEYQKTLRIMDGELRKLTLIIEGLFTLSMADAGQLRITKEPVYLNEVVEEACVLVAPRARAKDIAIDRALKDEVDYWGDETLLRQLFLIFLENAVKYSPPHTRVRVDMMRENGVVKTLFHDQGRGISSEHQSRIFERFYRVLQPEAGEAQSGGLGLAIAQAIARAQGGSIQCQSAPGRGSTFTVTLPLVQPAENGSGGLHSA